MGPPLGLTSAPTAFLWASVTDKVRFGENHFVTSSGWDVSGSGDAARQLLPAFFGTRRRSRCCVNDLSAASALGSELLWFVYVCFGVLQGCLDLVVFICGR